MINVAIVGYRMSPMGIKYPDSAVALFSNIIEGKLGSDIGFCFQDFVDNARPSDVEQLVTEMLESGPNILHYTNNREVYRKDGFDEAYLREVIRQSQEQGERIPILLSSGGGVGNILAENLGITFAVSTNLTPKNYSAVLKELTGR